jgi:hypothetical protein
MMRGMFTLLGYLIAAVLTLLLLPIGVILMIVFTVSDCAVRLFRKVFS